MVSVDRLRLARHRATTAHVCSAYPFLAEAGLGANGVYLGTNILTGGSGFAYDPFEAYHSGLLTNPNILFAGEPGVGKSATAKIFIYRSVGVFGRWAAIADPKGEYLPLAEALGLSVIKLHPGGRTRLNPLDPQIYLAEVGLATANFFLRRFEVALSWATKCLAHQENFAPALSSAMVSYAMLGRIADAQMMLARRRAVGFIVTISEIRKRNAYFQQEDGELFIEACRIAGVPDD